ncbi:MAG: gas vesicle protein GvpJ [Pseudomonadota bacterium]
MSIERDTSLAEAIDALLAKGVVVGAEVEISVAEVPLCRVSARLLAATVSDLAADRLTFGKSRTDEEVLS